MPSRTQVAKYLAKELSSGEPKNRAAAIRLVAGWLRATGQTKDIGYLVDGVSGALEADGYIFAKVYSAKSLDATLRAKVKKFIEQKCGASHVEVDFVVDHKLIGGVKIQTASGTLDDSIAGKLNRMLESIA